MSDEELLDYPLKVTLKGDGAAPWITAAGRDGASTKALLDEMAGSGLYQAAAEAGVLLSAATKVVNGFGAAGGPAAGAGGQSAPAGGHPSPGPQGAVAPAAPNTAPGYFQQPQGAPPVAQYNPNPGLPYQVPPVPQQPNGGAVSGVGSYPTPPPAQNFNGAPHPENLHCSQCGAPVVGKVTTKGSRLWSCPNQQAKGDGHYTKWLN